MGRSNLSRREFLRLSAVVGAGTVLAACAPQVTPSASDTSGGSDESDVVTIDIWTYPRTENDAEIVYAPMMEQFVVENPNINPQVEVQPWGGRREKLYAAAAAGTPPDIWYATTDTVPAYIEKGVILPLGDKLSTEDLADYNPAEVDAASLDGELYMPLVEAEVNGLAYSGTLLRELGHDPATAEFSTWDALHGLASDAADKGWFLHAFTTFSWSEWLVMVREAGGTVYADDRSRSHFTEQPSIDALTRWVTEYQNGWIPPEYAIGSVDEQGGMPDYWLSLEQVTARKEDAACAQDVDSNPDLEYVLGHPRSISADVPAVSGIVSGQGWAITQQSEAKDEALTWVKFMIRPDNIGWFNNLSGATPVGNESKNDWNPDPCVLDHVNRFSGTLFAGADTNTLWQESKVVCGPHFQAALLGVETVDQALEAISQELDALLQEKYG